MREEYTDSLEYNTAIAQLHRYTGHKTTGAGVMDAACMAAYWGNLLPDWRNIAFAIWDQWQSQTAAATRAEMTRRYLAQKDN
jgi:hypothetical protein